LPAPGPHESVSFETAERKTIMDKRWVAALAVVGVLSAGACKRDDGSNQTVADTATVPAMDTVNQPVAVPTTDTVVKTTTVDTDTIHGDAHDADSVHQDTAAHH
jgi:hypothetical protein